jgi:hypothetical protein
MNNEPPFNTPDVEYHRDDSGRFAPGNRTPNGNKKGRLGGRALALRTLDRMLAKDHNQDNLTNALQVHFDADPVRFFKMLMMPLLPQDLKVQTTPDTGFTWMTLADLILCKRSARIAFDDTTADLLPPRPPFAVPD